MTTDQSDEFSEVQSAYAEGSNSQGEWTYRVTAEGYDNPTNYDYDEIPQGGYQRVTLHGIFTDMPDISNSCYTVEANAYEFRLEYDESNDYEINWQNPTPGPNNSPGEITVGLTPPLPWWFSAGAAVSVPIDGQSYNEASYDYAHWDIDTDRWPDNQDKLSTVYIDLDHSGANTETKWFDSWGKFRWEYWDNCPEYHTYRVMTESQKTYCSFTMDVVDI